MSDESWRDVKTVFTEISNDYDSFVNTLVEHLRGRQEARYLSKSITYTPELVQEHRMFGEFLSKAQEGDVLQFYVWNAGFLRYSEGYQITRNGEGICSVTTLVS